ncbi:hypothetical protein DMA11_17105 [Marinilabiliaceae bacterium JC017]|nr:hypothetical protein DMA11_17105 [Marinilabiliaceae bacterium JC017]
MGEFFYLFIRQKLVPNTWWLYLGIATSIEYPPYFDFVKNSAVSQGKVVKDICTGKPFGMAACFIKEGKKYRKN